MPRSRTPSRGRQAGGSRSRSRGRQSPARASRSPGRVARSPGRSSRSPGRVARSPGRSSRSPGRVARSPGRSSRSPGRVSKSPSRASRSPGRVAKPARSSQSPPAAAPTRLTRSRSPARLAAAPPQAKPAAVKSATPPPERPAPVTAVLTSTPKSEVRARRPLTRTAAAPADLASPGLLVNSNSNSNNVQKTLEAEKETEPEPAPVSTGVTTRHSARIANKLRELGIDPDAGGDTAPQPPAAAEEELKPRADLRVSWGRALTTPLVLGIALLPLYVYSACNKKHCQVGRLPELPLELRKWLDPPALLCVLGFLALQTALALLPLGRLVEGQISKQGIRRHRCNGFLSLLVTVGGLLLAYQLGLPVPVALQKLRLLLVAAAVTALLAAPLLHLRSRSAHLLDLTAAGDTDSLLVNLSEGRELSPRLLGLDVKLLMTRVCCVGAVLLAALFVLADRELNRGGSSPTLLTAAAMVAGIGLDHMWFEDNLLTTYTFMNEGFGLKKMLALMMMPFCMTFNLRFIMVTGLSHPWYVLVGCVMLYLVGYLIQRSSNSQKNEFRKNPVNPALAHLETIPTTKGKKLLVSGWWGVVRHPNHLGGLLMIAAMSLLLGFRHALAWVLPACAALGVLLQARKVDSFCQHKYGAAWERYAARVRYSLVPSVF